MFVHFTQPEILIPVVTLGNLYTSLCLVQFYCITEKQQDFTTPRFMHQNLVYLGKSSSRNISFFYSGPKQSVLWSAVQLLKWEWSVIEGGCEELV